MEMNKRIASIILLSSLMAMSCVPTIYSLRVAPSYEQIKADNHDMTVLIKDYDAVLAVVEKWAARSQGKVESCSILLRYGGIGQTSPGCKTFHFVNFKMDVEFNPAMNSTEISILGRNEDGLRAKEDLSAELVAVFGEQSIIDPYSPKAK